MGCLIARRLKQSKEAKQWVNDNSCKNDDANIDIEKCFGMDQVHNAEGEDVVVLDWTDGSDQGGAGEWRGGARSGWWSSGQTQWERTEDWVSGRNRDGKGDGERRLQL